jgi:hypothetical protein
MAVPTGYIKAILLTTLPWVIIAALLGFIGYSAIDALTFSMIPSPINWVITFAQGVCFTVSGLLVAYMIIAAIHG